MVVEFLFCGLYGFVVYAVFKDSVGDRVAGFWGALTYAFFMIVPGAWKKMQKKIDVINKNLFEIKEMLAQMGRDRP
jgi:hypothetical protein